MRKSQSDEFVYLGSVISKDGGADLDIKSKRKWGWIRHTLRGIHRERERLAKQRELRDEALKMRRSQLGGHGPN